MVLAGLRMPLPEGVAAEVGLTAAEVGLQVSFVESLPGRNLLLVTREQVLMPLLMEELLPCSLPGQEALKQSSAGVFANHHLDHHEASLNVLEPAVAQLMPSGNHRVQQPSLVALKPLRQDELNGLRRPLPAQGHPILEAHLHAAFLFASQGTEDGAVHGLPHASVLLGLLDNLGPIAEDLNAQALAVSKAPLQNSLSHCGNGTQPQLLRFVLVMAKLIRVSLPLVHK
mmetsp:Transcript_51878/g.123455  ORF Transcript_51878/g.123455 Transcript_51878/m.123455 type:complete len:228 (-) Transcript_51878:1931-2614(-)